MKRSLKALFGSVVFALSLSGCSLLPKLPTPSAISSSVSEVEENQDKIKQVYNLYLQAGGTLSYEDWLDTIKGEKGDKGDNGKDGKDGKSAYEIYKEAHPNYAGSESQWLDDLVNGELGTKLTHIVTFNSNGGTKVASQAVLHGEKAVKPEEPYLEEHNFLRWEYQGEPWVFFGYPVTENITLEATWSYIHHVHEFERDYSASYEPTCVSSGYSVEVCTICGERMETILPPTGQHVYDNPVVISQARCDYPGQKQYTCIYCGETHIEQFYDSNNHNWGEDEKVEPNEELGTVGYIKHVCAFDNITGIEIRALDGTLAEGSMFKSGTPEGYMKLSSNGNSISYKFSYPEAAHGKIFLRATEDNWSTSYCKNGTFFNITSSSVTEENIGNFDLVFNDGSVDYTARRYVTYEQMLSNGVEDPDLAGQDYAPVALTEVGDVELKAGVNEFTFNRLTTFNLTIKDFVIYIGDASQFNINFPSENPMPVTRDWIEGTPAQNRSGKTYTPLTDRGTGKPGVKIALTDSSSGEYNSGKMSNSSNISVDYEIKAPEGGLYQMIMCGRVSTGSEERTFDQRLITASVNGFSNLANTYGERLYTDAGLNLDDYVPFVFAIVYLTGQEDTVSISNPNYRIVFDMDSYVVFAKL